MHGFSQILNWRRVHQAWSWTNSKGDVVQAATGTAEVGRLVSSYTRLVSSKEFEGGEFDELFRAEVEEGRAA